MTMMSEKEVECAVCGDASKHYSITSTNAFGSPDLDTRPPEMERSTIDEWVQRCPSCHYCAPDITKASPDVKVISLSDEYRHIVESGHLPEMASTFLATSYIQQQTGRFSEAAWRAIHAAWACDDENQLESAQSCRIKAIDLIDQATANGQVISCQAGTAETITIDLLRRSGNFDEALAFVEKTESEKLEDVIHKILQFEKVLIEKGDTEAHTIAVALGTDTD